MSGLGCIADVDPSATPPPAGACASIGPCLAAMPVICTTKTLRLAAGRYRGAANTRVQLNGTASVAIVGPAAPAPLRPGGAAELDAPPPAAAAVATIDGEGAAWLFAVGGSARLRLENLALARGRGGQFPMGEGMVVDGSEAMVVSGGGALRVTDSGAVNATGVLFDSNAALGAPGLSGSWGGAVFFSSDGAALVDRCVFRNNTATGSLSDGGAVHVRHLPTGAGNAASVAPVFLSSLFEGNSAPFHGGGTYVADAAPRFRGCTWRRNEALRGGSLYVESIFEASSSAVAPVFEQCLFENSSAANKGGGAYILEAVPRFSGCTWRGNKAAARGGALAVHSSTAGTATSVVPLFEQCLFEGNYAAHDGGGVCYKDAAPRMRNCTFRGNVAARNGGGLFLCSSYKTDVITIALEHITFIGNTAGGKDGGGALATFATFADAPANLAFAVATCSDFSCVRPANTATPPPDIRNTFRRWTPRMNIRFNGSTTFDGNEATAASGGAIQTGLGGSIVIEGAASFRNNRANIFGGAVHMAAGSSSLTLLGASTWVENFAGSAGGDHLFSDSSGAIALGNATLLLGGDPTREREGVVASQAGNVSWGAASSAACEAGYTLRASSDVTSSIFQGWVLEGSSNGTAGFRNGSNCPGYYASCDGVGPSKSTDPYWTSLGLPDPKAAPVFPPMLTTRLVVGCTACGATEWSSSAAAAPLPGPVVAAATTARPLARTCAACEGAMSPGITCEAGMLIQQENWWRPAAAAGFGTPLYRCYRESCAGSVNGTTGLPPFDAQCSAGYTGPVCALCADGFTMQSGECRACPRLNAQNVTGVTLLLLAALACGAVAYRKRNSPLMSRAIIKITVGFFQLAVTMERSFYVAWPGNYRNALHGTKMALASVADLPSTACAFTVNWFARQYIWTFGMLGAALGLWCRYRWLVARGGSGGSGGSGAAAKATLLRHLFYLAFFCYPLSAPVIVSLFDCRTIAGVPYLDADYSLACAGGTYALAAAWAALWTAGFVLGFPVFVALALHRRYAVAEFLADDYTGGALQRQWEVVSLLRKLLLSSAVIFLPRSSVTRTGVALLVAVTFQVLQAHFAPWDTVNKNRMANAADAALSLTYFLALMVDAFPASKDKDALGVLLCTLLVFVALAAVGAVVAIRRETQWQHRFKGCEAGTGTAAAAATLELEAQSSVANPAYAVEQSELPVPEQLKALAELRAELAKAQAAHAAQLEGAQAEVQAERERSAAEAKGLRAELAQLLKKGQMIRDEAE